MPQKTNRAATSVKVHGQHYTPPKLAEFLANHVVAVADLDRSELTIIDPACGDGELLVAVARSLKNAGYLGILKLIGYDIDAAAVEQARARLHNITRNAQVIQGDFLLHQRELPTHSVDIIITNPPYVRTQNLGHETAQLLAEEFHLTGRVDLTHPFVAASSRLLMAHGTLGLLCSNRFLTTLAGENIRRTFMAGDLHITELYDLGDTKLFQAAVLPAIVIATRTTLRRETPRFVNAYHTPTSTSTANLELFDALNAPTSSIAAHNGKLYDVRVGTLRMPDDTKTPWRLSDPTADEWLATINAATWRSFGDVAKIRVGIKTTANNVFLADDWEHRAPLVEADLLHPLITQHNITPWAISPHLTMRVLYPYDLTSEKRRVLNINDWPGAKSYLLQHYDQLSGRAYVVKSGREWYEIWVPQRPALWAAPKIVFPDISDTPRFALDTSGAIVNGNCYWISLADVGDEDIAYLMLAVANSSLGVRYYDEVCGNRLYSGKRRWITQYINRLPLPYPDTDASRELIALAKQLVAGRNATGNRDDAVGRLNELVERAFTESSKQNELDGEDTTAPLMLF